MLAVLPKCCPFPFSFFNNGHVQLPRPNRYLCESLTYLLTAAVYRQLQEYEQKIFGLMDGCDVVPPVFPSLNAQPFSFGFPKVNDPVPPPAFNVSTGSIFSRPPLDIPPQEFTFGASQLQKSCHESPLTANSTNSNGGDTPMDSA